MPMFPITFLSFSIINHRSSILPSEIHAMTSGAYLTGVQFGFCFSIFNPLPFAKRFEVLNFFRKLKTTTNIMKILPVP